MKKFIIPLLLITLLFVGCSKSNGANEHVNGPGTPQKTKTTKQEKKSYQSVTEYHNLIDGNNFKTGKLNIKKNGDYLNLNLDFVLSQKLKSIMMNTKNKFYFTFSDIEGQDKINKILVEKPSSIEGNLEKLQVNDHYHLVQKIKIKRNLSSLEEKTALSPGNYELVVLNEKSEAVAVIIGLDLDMINQ